MTLNNINHYVPLADHILAQNLSPNATCQIRWNITKNIGAGVPAVNSVYSLCLKDSLSYQSSLRKKHAPLLIFAFLSAFFHKINSNVSRDMLEIQTE